jgi:hypothetical protein
MKCPRCHVLLTIPLKDHMAIHIASDMESCVWKLKNDMREYGIPEIRIRTGMHFRMDRWEPKR